MQTHDALAAYRRLPLFGRARALARGALRAAIDSRPHWMGAAAAIVGVGALIALVQIQRGANPWLGLVALGGYYPLRHGWSSVEERARAAGGHRAHWADLRDRLAARGMGAPAEPSDPPRA